MGRLNPSDLKISSNTLQKLEKVRETLIDPETGVQREISLDDFIEVFDEVEMS